jgi:O-antigen ligase
VSELALGWSEINMNSVPVREPVPLVAIPGTWLGAALAVAAALWAGLSWVSGQSGVAVLTPIVVFIGSGLAILGLVRFEALLIVSLFARASLDGVDDALDAQVAGMDLTQVFTLVFAALGLIWMATTRQEGHRPSGLVGPLAAFVVVAALGTMVAPDMSVGAPDVGRFATLLVLVMVLERYLIDERRRRMVVLTIIGSAVIPIAVGTFQSVAGRDLDFRGEFGRVHGTLNHPNPFAIYLVFVSVLAVALLLNVAWRYRAYLAVFSVIGVWMLVLTYTRGAWIALVIGLGVVLGIGHRRLLPYFAVGVVVLAVLLPGVRDRFGDLDTAVTQTGAPGNSLAWRIGVWQETLSEVENPVTGNGLRTSESLIESGKLPHNDFVRVYVELGLIGLAVYGWWLLRLGQIARNAMTGAFFGLNRGIALAFAGTFAAFLLVSMNSNVISQLVLLWYLVAVAVLAATAQDEPTTRPPAHPMLGVSSAQDSR